MPNKIGKKNQISVADINPQSRVVFALMLIILGILGRTVLHLGHNIEFVTSASLIAGSFLGLTWSILIPLVIMAFSDLILGNTTIFIFTWSAYLAIGIVGYFFLHRRENSANKIIKATFLGIMSSVIFFLWTNFGVWALDSFGMYKDDFSGLVDSYIMGIPFLKANIFSNLLIVPVYFIIFTSYFAKNSNKSLNKKNLIYK